MTPVRVFARPHPHRRQEVDAAPVVQAAGVAVPLGPCVLWHACHQPAVNGFAPFIEFLTIRLLKEDGHLGASVERWTATSDGEAFRCMRSDAPAARTPESHIVAALRLWLAQNPPSDITTGGKSMVLR